MISQPTLLAQCIPANYPTECKKTIVCTSIAAKMPFCHRQKEKLYRVIIQYTKEIILGNKITSKKETHFIQEQNVKTMF